MSFHPYPQYKDSGVEWLGEVPEHWQSRKIAHAYSYIGGGTTPPSSEEKWYADGTIPWVTTGELRENTIFSTKKMVTKEAVNNLPSLRIHPKGSLLIALYGATIGRLGFLGIDATCNQACCVLANPSTLMENFTFYWLLAFKENIIKLFSTGGGQPNISQDVVLSLKLPAPSTEEQTQIARFLDHETSKIDGLIAEQEQLIELLKEKRQATISHAVTKGLNPDTPMKDSGVKWLGKVPAHWVKKRLKNISPFITVGIVVNPSSYVSDTGLPYIYGGEIKEGFIESEKARKITHEDSLKNHKTRLKTDDLVTVRVGYPGITAVVPPECEGGNCASVMLIRNGNYISNWLCYVMNSWLIRHQVEIVQYGAAQKQFNIADAIEFWAFTPEKQEQLNIAEYLDRETTKLDTLLTEAQRGIELLKERRSALISAAVTGKIDVRNWQPQGEAA